MKKLLISALMLMLAIPAMAMDISTPEGTSLSIYAQARMALFYQNSDTGQANTDAKNDLKYLMQGNSRFGFNASVGKVYGNVEFNFVQDGTANLGFRQLWVGYKFDNGGYILAGQKTTLTGYTGFTDVYMTDNGLNGFGAVGDTRRPQLQYGIAGFAVALVTIEGRDDANYAWTKSVGTPAEVTVNASAKSGDRLLPRIELAYNFPMKQAPGKVFGSFALVNVKDTVNNIGKDITAFHIGACINPKFGNAYVKFSAFYAMNAGLYAAVKKPTASADGTANMIPSLKTDAAGKFDGVNDVSTFGVAAAVGYGITKAFTLELGGGYQSSTADDMKDLNSYAFYLSAPWAINKYIKFTPQVGYYAVSQVNDGHSLLAGAQLIMSF